MTLVIDPQAMLRDELDRSIGQLAAQLVEDGTLRHRPALEAIADSLSTSSPGAAAALVDWSGAEVARLRAFGVAHGVALARLGAVAQLRLLDMLRGVEVERAA